MRKDIQIQLVEAPGKRGQLTAFRIIHAAPTATLAQQVATQLTSLFIDENIQEQSQRAENTTDFLSSELNGRAESSGRTGSQGQAVQEPKPWRASQPDGRQRSYPLRVAGALSQPRRALNRAQEQRLYLESLLAQYRFVRTGEAGADARRRSSASWPKCGPI